MFANLTYQDKQAFFSLLDEYFESRPHLLGGGSSEGITIKPAHALAAASTMASAYNAQSGRGGPPPVPSRSPAPAHGSSNTPPYSPAGEAPATPAANSPLASAQQASQKTMNFMSSNVNKVAANSHVNSALGKVGMAGKFNKPAPYTYSGIQQGERTLPPPPPSNPSSAAPPPSAAARGSGPPPPPQSRPRGAPPAGLTSSRGFGHVDTSSGGAALKTMFRDPKKVTPPTVDHHVPPALGNAGGTLPPPPRHVGAGAAASPGPNAAQAQVLYDFEGADTTDLPVHENQVVTIEDKASADWWTCRDDNGNKGFVPANYLKEL